VKNLLIVLIVLIPLWVTADDQKPNAKETARISKIEHDFNAHFIQAMDIRSVSPSSQGISSVYWAFVKLDPTALFKSFMFSVPKNASDQSVIRAIVSSIQAEQFDAIMIQKMIQKMREASPDPSPTAF
jgi:hypothetical protein